MISLCAIEDGTIVFRSLKRGEDGTLITQVANSCIDMPVRLWMLYNQAFFNLQKWNPRLVVLNASLETPTYGLCLDNPPQPDRIVMPEDYLSTISREVVITRPDKVAPGVIFLPSTLFMDTLGRVLYVLHEIETRKCLLTQEELLAAHIEWRALQEEREKVLSPHYPAAYRRGIFPHLRSYGTFQFRAIQEAGKDSTTLVHSVSSKVLKDRYANNPLNLSRCLQGRVKQIRQRLREESMTMEWSKILSFALHAELPGFWDTQPTEDHDAPLFTVSV